MAVDLSRLVALSEDLRGRTIKAKREEGRSWFRVQNLGSSTKIYIYDEIGEWGITAQDFVGELSEVRASSIDLHLNCKGGEVFDGLAMYAALRNHPANVTVYVDSIAASAASFIAQAGNRRVMEPNARMMIHEAHGLQVGNAADMLEMHKLLEDASDNIAAIYADRSGVGVKDWRKAMKNETWYSAEEAVAAGLADEVARTSEPENKTPAAPVAELDQPTVAWDPKKFLSTVTEAVA